MNWTKDKPTAPDTWWWYRETEGNKPGESRQGILRVIEWQWLPGEPLVAAFSGTPKTIEVNELNGDWAGPLEAPSE